MPAERRLLEMLVEQGRRVFPEGTWTAAGIGRHQSEGCGWAIMRAGRRVATAAEARTILGLAAG